MRTRSSVQEKKKKKDVERVIEELNQETFEIEEIIGSEIRSRKGRREKFYLVKFRNYSYEDAEYYRASDIRKFCLHGDEMIRKYEEKVKELAEVEASKEKSKTTGKRSADESLPQVVPTKAQRVNDLDVAQMLQDLKKPGIGALPANQLLNVWRQAAAAKVPTKEPEISVSFFDKFANAYAPEMKMEEEEVSPKSVVVEGESCMKSTVDSKEFTQFLTELSNIARKAAEGRINNRSAWRQIGSLTRTLLETKENETETTEEQVDEFGFLDQVPVKPTTGKDQPTEKSSLAWEQLAAAAVGARAPPRPPTPPVGPRTGGIPNAVPITQHTKQGDFLADHERFNEANISAWVRPEEQDVVVRLEWPDGTVQKVPAAELHQHPHCLYALTRYYEERIVQGAPDTKRVAA